MSSFTLVQPNDFLTEGQHVWKKVAKHAIIYVYVDIYTYIYIYIIYGNIPTTFQKLMYLLIFIC